MSAPRRVRSAAVLAGPISPPSITEYRPEYLPAYVSNGMLGLRIGRIPFVEGLCMVDGLVERDPVEDGEGFARAPYPLWGDVTVDGHGLAGTRNKRRSSNRPTTSAVVSCTHASFTVLSRRASRSTALFSAAVL